MRIIILVIVTISSFILSGESSANDLQDHSVTYINNYKKDICQAASHTNVPPALLAGVIIAEAELNRSLTDRIQDAMLVRMLKITDIAWWDQWQKQGELLARKSKESRSISNKWPIELWRTGYVQTFGSPQIAPRTAILACKNLEKKYGVCRDSIRSIIENISKDPESFLIAAIVLDNERKQYQNSYDVDLSESIGEWATIYNVGSDFIIMSHSTDHQIKPNRFGRHVLKNYSYIDQLLKCGSTPDKSDMTSSSSGHENHAAEQ